MLTSLAGKGSAAWPAARRSDRRILIDCGLFKGWRELDEEDSESFGFDTPCIDDLLFTQVG